MKPTLPGTISLDGCPFCKSGPHRYYVGRGFHRAKRGCGNEAYLVNDCIGRVYGSIDRFRRREKYLLTPDHGTGFTLSTMKMKGLTIGHLAKAAGVNLETVRYYERRGLLPRPPRSPSGYRIFPSDAARRLRFIRRAQELGFSLTEIRELLSLRSSRTATSRDIRKRAEAKIADVETKIKSLEAIRKALRKLTDTCDGCSPLTECPILESLERADE